MVVNYIYYDLLVSITEYINCIYFIQVTLVNHITLLVC